MSVIGINTNQKNEVTSGNPIYDDIKEINKSDDIGKTASIPITSRRPPYNLELNDCRKEIRSIRF